MFEEAFWHLTATHSSGSKAGGSQVLPPTVSLCDGNFDLCLAAQVSASPGLAFLGAHGSLLQDGDGCTLPDADTGQGKGPEETIVPDHRKDGGCGAGWDGHDTIWDLLLAVPPGLCRESRREDDGGQEGTGSEKMGIPASHFRASSLRFLKENTTLFLKCNPR